MKGIRQAHVKEEERKKRNVHNSDTIHGQELIPLQTDSRDMSFVRVSIIYSQGF
jgi:hypothetical protein